MAGISRSKDLNDLAKKAMKQGWVITLRNNGHLAWKSPKGGVVFSASSPSDYRAIKNTIRELKKFGFIN